MNEHSKRASATKKGPGRYATSGKPGNRITKARPVRAYRALMAAWASKRVPPILRNDEHGSFTFTGSSPFTRRMWLAGISAQRGY